MENGNLNGIVFSSGDKKFKVVQITSCGLHIILTENAKINALQKHNLTAIWKFKTFSEVAWEDDYIGIRLLAKDIHNNEMKLAVYFDDVGLNVIAKSHYKSAMMFAIDAKMYDECRCILDALAERDDLTTDDNETIIHLDYKLRELLRT